MLRMWYSTLLLLHCSFSSGQSSTGHASRTDRTASPLPTERKSTRNCASMGFCPLQFCGKKNSTMYQRYTHCHLELHNFLVNIDVCPISTRPIVSSFRRLKKKSRERINDVWERERERGMRGGVTLARREGGNEIGETPRRHFSSPFLVKFILQLLEIVPKHRKKERK